jgi:flagellar hook-associated protein 2
MAISAPGLGSNLDVNSIVSQLMTIEQRPRLLLDKGRLPAQPLHGQLRGAFALESAVRGRRAARFERPRASVADSTVSGLGWRSGGKRDLRHRVTQFAQRQSLTQLGRRAQRPSRQRREHRSPSSSAPSAAAR